MNKCVFVYVYVHCFLFYGYLIELLCMEGHSYYK